MSLLEGCGGEGISKSSTRKCTAKKFAQVQIISIRYIGRVKRCTSPANGGNGRCHNLNYDKEASEVAEGKSSNMRWGR